MGVRPEGGQIPIQDKHASGAMTPRTKLGSDPVLAVPARHPCRPVIDTNIELSSAPLLAVPARHPPCLVIDTNIVLDLFVFDDPAAHALKAKIETGSVQWLATQPMRDELQRVLGYPQITPRLAARALEAQAVLAQFDRWASPCAVAPRASAICSDPDDQKFIDLAVARRSGLLSKDRAILRLRKRLLALGVRAQSVINSIA